MAQVASIIAGLAVIFFMPGCFFLRFLRGLGRAPSCSGPGSWLFLSVLVSVLSVSWVGLILAELSIFSLAAIFAILIAISLALLVISRRVKSSPTRSHAHTPKRSYAHTLILLASITALCLLIYSPPYEYVLGNWDPGCYVNSGGHLARSGSILIDDRVLKEIPAGDRELFYDTRLYPQRYEAMAIADSERGIVSPHFYHLYTVWIAIFHELGGLRFSLWVNIFFGFLSLAAFIFAAREVAGRGSALLAALLLAFSAAQVWSVRFPNAELMAQFLLFSGLFCLFRYQESGETIWGVLAGTCMAELLLTVFTAIAILPLLALIIFWRNWDRLQKRDLSLIIPIAAGIANLVAQDLTVCRSYVARQMEVLRAQGVTPSLLLASSALFVGILVSLMVFARGAKIKLKHFLNSPYARFAIALLLAALFVHAYYIWPRVSGTPDARSLREIGWFLYPFSLAGLSLPLGLYLAIAGIMLFLKNPWDERRGAFFLVAALTGILLISRKMVFPSYPWAMRRYMPLVFPSLILFLCVALVRISKLGKSGAAAVITVFSLIIVSQAGLLKAVLPTEYAGTIEFLDSIAGRLDRGGLHIVEGSGIAAPLDCAYGLDVLHIRAQTPEKCRRVEKLVAELISKGRRVYYISRGGWPISLALDFIPISETPFVTDHLEYTVGRFPSKRTPVEVNARVFRVKSPPFSHHEREKVRAMDVGEDCFGLIRGFRDPILHWMRRDGKKLRRLARWTDGDAEMVIPTLGSSGDVILTVSATAGKERPDAPVPVTVLINGKKAGEIALGRSWEERSIRIASSLLPSGEERALMRLKSPVWRTAAARQPLGICLDWIEVSPGR